MLLSLFIIFLFRYTFKQHNKSHEGEKCFKCELCPYASTSARHLESHMLVHTEQKPYQCDQCDQVPLTVGISPLCFWLKVRYLSTYCICKLIYWNSSPFQDHVWMDGWTTSRWSEIIDRCLLGVKEKGEYRHRTVILQVSTPLFFLSPPGIPPEAAVEAASKPIPQPWVHPAHATWKDSRVSWVWEGFQAQRYTIRYHSDNVGIVN